MARANCFFPITLRVTGRLSDAQLEAAAGALTRAVRSRLAFARSTLAERGISMTVSAQSAELSIPFDQDRLSPDESTYAVASYDSGGRAARLPVRLRRARRPTSLMTDEIRDAVTKHIDEQALDAAFLADAAWVAAWHEEVVSWVQTTFFPPLGRVTKGQQRALLKRIENEIVIPLMTQRLQAFYGTLGDPFHTLALAPEVEFRLLPAEVRGVVGGGLAGWQSIRDEIADGLAIGMQGNLLWFYGMVPDGKMTTVKLWPGGGSTLVHEDLAAALQSIGTDLAALQGVLDKDSPSFQFLDKLRHNSPLGLQIRHMHGSAKRAKTLSPHHLGKSVDILAYENPHFLDERLLVVLGLFGGMNARLNLRGFKPRRELIERHRLGTSRVVGGRDEFVDFMQDAETRYNAWSDAQIAFQDHFPQVTRASQLPVDLEPVIKRVEAERDRVKAVLDAAVAAGAEAERQRAEAAEAKAELPTRVQAARKELADARRDLRQLQRTPTRQRSPDVASAIIAARDRVDAAQRDERAIRSERHPLNRRLEKAQAAVERNAKEVKGLSGEHAMVRQLSTDLINDQDLLFREKTVVNPGLATMQQQGFLSLPWEVVQVFLSHGFDWGGFWEHPDFMHFDWLGKVSGER
jgi:hypothetical protein